MAPAVYSEPRGHTRPLHSSAEQAQLTGPVGAPLGGASPNPTTASQHLSLGRHAVLLGISTPSFCFFPEEKGASNQTPGSNFSISNCKH